MAYEGFQRVDPPWQSATKNGQYAVQIAFNHAGIPFWRSKRWFENDKAWSQWMPLAKTETADEAYAQACERLGAEG